MAEETPAGLFTEGDGVAEIDAQQPQSFRGVGFELFLGVEDPRRHDHRVEPTELLLGGRQGGGEGLGPVEITAGGSDPAGVGAELEIAGAPFELADAASQQEQAISALRHQPGESPPHPLGGS